MGALTNIFGSAGRKGRVVLSIVTVITGIVVMWGSTVGSAKAKNPLKEASEGAVTIDARIPDPQYNGKLVLAAASLKSDEMLGDEFVKAGPYLVLRRHVEMLQWIERRDTGSSENVSYVMDWHAGEVDSFSFREPTGHENPLLKVTPQKQRAKAVRFGGFSGEKILDQIVGLSPVSLTKEMLQSAEHELVDNRIYIRRTPGSLVPELGDMRVWYDALPQGEYTVLTIQESVETLIDTVRAGVLFIRPGALSLSEFSDISSKTDAGPWALILLGASIFFSGLFSLLAPFAARIDLRPSVNLKGVPAAAFISFGVALVLAITFGVAALIG